MYLADLTCAYPKRQQFFMMTKYDETQQNLNHETCKFLLVAHAFYSDLRSKKPGHIPE